MDIIPLNSFKRDEIYSFIGGFCIAGLWSLHFANSVHTSLSDITNITSLRFLIFWLYSTAALYLAHLLLVLLISYLNFLCLRKKEDNKLKAILGLEGLTECYIFSDFINELRMQNHVIGIITTGIILTFTPLYNFISMFTIMSFCCYCWILALLILALLIFLFVSYRQFLTICSLKKKDLIEIIDQGTYTKERALYFANSKNKQSNH